MKWNKIEGKYRTVYYHFSFTTQWLNPPSCVVFSYTPAHTFLVVLAHNRSHGTRGARRGVSPGCFLDAPPSPSEASTCMRDCSRAMEESSEGRMMDDPVVNTADVDEEAGVHVDGASGNAFALQVDAETLLRTVDIKGDGANDEEAFNFKAPTLVAVFDFSSILQGLWDEDVVITWSVKLLSPHPLLLSSLVERGVRRTRAAEHGVGGETCGTIRVPGRSTLLECRCD